jgi:hypothetical protein
MDFGLGYIGVGIGAGLAILGAGLGIGRIGGQAVEGMMKPGCGFFKRFIWKMELRTEDLMSGSKTTHRQHLL